MATSLENDPELGYAVAVSADGTTALVGAPGLNRAEGAVYVFHASGAGSWSSTATPTAKLTSGLSRQQLFGLSVGLSADGTTAFVGAPLAGATRTTEPGAVYVFHVAAEDGWESSSSPTATLTVSHGMYLGISLAVAPDGATVIIGAPFYNNFAGGAYVFHGATEATWLSSSAPTAILSYGAEAQDDFLVGAGVAISADGTTALLNDSNNPNGGGALVYHVVSEALWTSSSTPGAILSDANSGPEDYLGNDLALSGDGTVAILGAPGVDSDSGAAKIYHATAEDSWVTTSTPTATLTGPAAWPGNVFGVRVALSTDGKTAAVTAPGIGTRRGGAYIFRAADEASWASSSSQAATLTDSTGHAKDDLGVGLGLSGDGATVVLGDPGARFVTGAADVFHADDATTWVTTSTPAATLTVAALDTCIVPKLFRLRLHAARAALKARSCRLGKVTRVHAPSKKYRGRIVFQSVKAGSRPPVGTKVGVEIGK